MSRPVIKKILKNIYGFSVRKPPMLMWGNELEERCSENYDPYEYVYESMHGDDNQSKAELIEEWDWGD